jgi:phosphonate transport system ATP-binding protein
MLEIRDLRVVYPNGVEALAAASLTVNAGEVVALIGRSGAGKSTLLRCINGLQAAASGSIRLEGVEVTTRDRAALADLRRSIGFIWQEHNLVQRLSVFTNVLTGRLGHHRGLASLLHYFSSTDREIAVQNLERVDLLHRASQRADRLSGGEKQRAAIARALAQQPRLIIADEPVASLDVALGAEVMSTLVRHRARPGHPSARDPARPRPGAIVRRSPRWHRGRPDDLRRTSRPARADRYPGNLPCGLTSHARPSIGPSGCVPGRG